MQIDWAYMRKGWASCKKAWAVFTDKQATIAEEVDARKQVYNGDDAFKVVADAERILVASGKKILEFDPQASEKDLLIKKITGPTGNLRAPTLRLGTTYYVGFNQELYDGLG